MDRLKEKVLTIIEHSADDIKSLIFILNDDLFTDQHFQSEITKILDILTKDRDGNLQFDVNDLKLIGSDPLAITSLISSLMILIAQVRTLHYDADRMEQFIIKLLFYIFLVLLPEKTDIYMSSDDKRAIVDIVMSIYQFLKSSEIVKDMIKKIKNWIKSSCCTKQDNQDILLAKSIKQRTLLNFTVKNLKQERQLKEL